MFYKTRFLLSLLVLCAALTACSDNASPDATNAETIEQQVETTPSSPSATKVEIGMSEQAVTDLLGAPTFVQTRTLDSLTITHSEWVDETGTTSVQFQNGKVQFNQFTPTNK